MKIFIDGFGVVGHEITRQLLAIFGCHKDDLLVNTYSTADNYGFVEWLEKNRIRNFCASYKTHQCFQKIVEFKPTIILSLYGRRIFPGDLLEIAELGAINLHPSLLPDYKGCFSAPWAIINAEKETGITFHAMDSGIDTGDLLMQETVAIQNHDTAFTLYNALVQKFILTFPRFFSDYCDGRVIPQPSGSGGRYYERKLPFEGLIAKSWDEAQVERFIRAMHFPTFPMARMETECGLVEIPNLAEWRRHRSL